MNGAERFAVEHPALRRVLVLAVVAVLLLFLIAEHDTGWNRDDIASLLIVIASGAAAAVVSARADTALRRAANRTQELARRVAVLAPVAGSVAALVLAHVGSVSALAVCGGFMIGFGAVAAFLYPRRAD